MTRLSTAAGIVMLLLSTAAHAASITVIRTQPAILPGYTAYEIWWDGGGSQDWTDATLIVDLTQGTTYQDPLGGDNPPSEVLINFSPTLAYDTYVGILGDTTGGIQGCATGCLPSVSLDAPHIDVGWYNTAQNDTGPVKIGNVTVSDDAFGVYRLQSAGMVVEGVIPEPAGLLLLTLAAPALLRRG